PGFVEATTVVHTGGPREQLTRWEWVGRAASGLALGWIWSSLLSLGWVALAATAYGDFDRALVRLKGERWASIAFAAFSASLPASFLGGMVGALIASRSRRPVLGSSARGGIWGAALGVVAGVLAGWAVGKSLARSPVLVWLALGLGVLAGLIGGWLGGQAT